MALSPSKDPDRPRRPVWWLTLAGLAAALAMAAAGYTLFWFTMADRFRQEAGAWRAVVRAQGGVADWQRLDIHGFPLWLRATVIAPRRGEPLAESPWLWQAPRAEAAMRPWNFNRVSVDLAGAHELQVTAGGRTVPLSGRAEALDVTLARLPGAAWTAQAAIAGLALAGPPDVGAIALAKGDVTARRLDPADGHMAANWALALRGEGLVLPDSLALPLGREVPRLVLDARLLGRLPPGPLESSLAEWRDAGGTVEVTRLEAEWGPLAVQGDGTMALDAELQPIGAFTARAQGFFEALEALRRQGVIDGRDAMTATVVLGVMSRRPANGGPASLSVPLSIQSRSLFVGPVAVSRLPEVRWTGEMPDL